MVGMYLRDQERGQNIKSWKELAPGNSVKEAEDKDRGEGVVEMLGVTGRSAASRRGLWEI